MPQKKMTSFHKDLSEYLKKSTKGKQTKKFLELIDTFEKGSQENFDELISSYHALSKEALHLERDLLRTFTWKDFQRLDLPPNTYPKMLRGLPRFYDRNKPSHSEIKTHFTNLDHLKLQYIDKALFHLYRDVEIVEPARVVIFTWVMNDGFGDFTAQRETANVIKHALPGAEIHLVSVLQNDIPQKISGMHHHKVFYQHEKDLKVEILPQDVLEIMATSHFILQMPTYFPDTVSLKKKLEEISDIPPKFETLGQYGFIDSKPFHPSSNNRSLGLYFLEKGILVKNISKENPTFQTKLFEDLDKYKKTHAFNLFYLYSKEGAFISLYSVFKKRKNDAKHLDFITPNADPLIEMFEKFSENLFEGMNIKEVEIHLEKQTYTIPIQKKGKMVRFFCNQKLSSRDFQNYMRISDDLVVVRGDQSFSDAISCAQMYFYDAPYHSKNFLKDLLSLAEYYLKDYPETLSFMRLFPCGIKKKRTREVYVEEEFFQKGENKPQVLAEIAYECLTSPRTFEGMKKLSRILYKYYSANDFLCSLVKRGLLHYHIPEIEQYEKKITKEFLEEAITFPDLIDSLRLILSPHKMRVPITSQSFLKKVESTLWKRSKV